MNQNPCINISTSVCATFKKRIRKEIESNALCCEVKQPKGADRYPLGITHTCRSKNNLLHGVTDFVLQTDSLNG